jgi:hypothetical protein
MKKERFLIDLESAGFADQSGLNHLWQSRRDSTVGYDLGDEPLTCPVRRSDLAGMHRRDRR